MKKIFSLLLVFAMILSLCACGGNKPVDVKGAFYKEGSVAIVFDYSDFESPLPENAEEITLSINGAVYNAQKNLQSTSHNTGVTHKLFDDYERYYGYSYALGYGKVSQNTPIRMMVVFNVDDVSGLNDVVFTLGNHTVNLEESAFTEINTLSEIIKVEENFEEAYQIASFKWRIDSAYTREQDMDIYRVPFGSDFNYLSEQISLTFDSDVNWGVEISASPGTNFSYKGKLDEDVVNINLPSFDVNAVKKVYPDASSQIDKIIQATNTLAKDILDSSKSLSDFDVKGNRGAIKGTYAELCEIFDMDLIIAN